MRLGHIRIHEWRRIHALLVVSKLRSIRVLLRVGVSDGLIKSASHRDVIGEVGREASIEVCRTRLEVRRESPILHRQIVVFLFVHFLVNDILLGNTQRTTSASFVNFRGPPSGLHTCLKTSVTSSRGSDVSTTQMLDTIDQVHGIDDVPLLVLFMGSLSLEHLGGWNCSLCGHC